MKRSASHADLHAYKNAATVEKPGYRARTSAAHLASPPTAHDGSDDCSDDWSDSALIVSNVVSFQRPL